MEQYYEQLVFEIDKLPSGRIFKIREIIGAEEWRKLDLKKRMDIGNYFYKKAITDGELTKIIGEYDKDVQGEQRYEKL